MSLRLLLRSLLVWFLFIPIAILNGFVRNILYQPFTGKLLAHQISTVIASIAFITLAYLTLRNQFSYMKTKALIVIGAIWVTMTIIFEFCFGHFITGHSWEKLIEDYNVFQGRVWPLFLFITSLTPLIVKRIHNLKKI